MRTLRTICAALALAWPGAATAEDEDRASRRLFFFGGIDLARDCDFTWAGGVLAPFDHIDADGLRVRVFAGHGHYRYRTGIALAGENRGRIDAGEVLLGRRLAFDSTTLTLYVGAHAEHHALRTPDPGNPLRGTRLGLKALLELHTRRWPGFVATAAIGASTATYAYTARGTVARELGAWQLGIEAAAFGNLRYSEIRAGLLARVPIMRLELTLSGGLLTNSNKGAGAYSTLLLYVPL
jgi:hypothetical protein